MYACMYVRCAATGGRGVTHRVYTDASAAKPDLVPSKLVHTYVLLFSSLLCVKILCSGGADFRLNTITITIGFPTHLVHTLCQHTSMSTRTLELERASPAPDG